MSKAIFVLSTGRCGTQWLANFLKDNYSDTYHVEHEPLHNSYNPRKMIARVSDTDLASDWYQPIKKHTEKLNRLLKHSNYIECGHPCWSSIPFLINNLDVPVKVIHLTRHPVYTACSWLTHSAFQPSILPHLQEKVLLSPFDKDVLFHEYKERWDKITPFEKCLYYWAEVNGFGLDLKKRMGPDLIRICYEDVFQGDGLVEILDFMDRPFKKEIHTIKKQTIDKYYYLTSEVFDPEIISLHPAILNVAESLGYDALKFDKKRLHKRYSGSHLFR